MTQAQTKPAPTEVKRSLRTFSVKNEAEVLASLQLPEGAKILIVPTSAAEEALLEGAARLKRSSWEVRVRAGHKPFLQSSNSMNTKIGVAAYEPDARARALLRGREYVRADLRDAGGASDVGEVRSLLNDITRQALDKRVNEGTLLVVPGPSNRRRFPTFQFTDDGEVVAGLKPVREALGYSSPWSVLNFLVNPQDALGGERPIDRLRKGDVDSVIEAAQRAGVQGA